MFALALVAVLLVGTAAGQVAPPYALAGTVAYARQVAQGANLTTPTGLTSKDYLCVRVRCVGVSAGCAWVCRVRET